MSGNQGGDDDSEFVVTADQLRDLMASGHPALIEAMQRGLAQMVGTSSGYLEGLPAPVRTRIEYLDALQEEYDELEDKFEREVREIEEKYKKLYTPLFEKRRAVISGESEAPDNENEEGKKILDELKGKGEDIPAGVPDFWLVTLRNHPALEEIITDKDAEVLSHLLDVTTEDLFDEDGNDEGYKITFHFAENPYFTDKSLSVTYFQVTEGGYVQVRDIEGSDIHWRPDKDMTVKKMKKKPKPGSKAKPQVKVEPVESFFRTLFSPPEVPDMNPDADVDEEGDGEEMDALREAVQDLMDIGEAIRDIVPHAVEWFTGRALAELEEEEDDEEEEDEGDDDDDDDDDHGEEDEEEESSDGEDCGPGAAKDAKEQPAECKQQ